ncbi:hypothetical protein IFM46972_06031 [Aspergillus udagawae]|uniref:Uncharacterized protein n=1 Tax=Aspergillus udagawae TaxID=91492 RepID=A0A8H3RU34_9EURO|nr:hypothetical protein IFM46972_06031 [Aspergillus udagawae]
MGWSVEAIIALVTLLVTGPASLLLLWNHVRNRNRQILRDPHPDRQQSQAMLPWTLTATDTEYNPRILEAGLGTYYVPAEISIRQRAIAEVQVSYRLADD